MMAYAISPEQLRNGASSRVLLWIIAFYGSNRDNPFITNHMAGDEDLLKALKLSYADHLVLGQSQGLDLELHEVGRGLPGRQNQPFIVARTLSRSPNIFLRYGPSASLDDIAEQRIVRELWDWLGARTVIVAEARYSLLALADRITVVDCGRVVLDGLKEDILAKHEHKQKPASASMAGSATPPVPVKGQK